MHTYSSFLLLACLHFYGFAHFSIFLEFQVHLYGSDFNIVFWITSSASMRLKFQHFFVCNKILIPTTMISKLYSMRSDIQYSHTFLDMSYTISNIKNKNNIIINYYAKEDISINIFGHHISVRNVHFATVQYFILDQ